MVLARLGVGATEWKWVCGPEQECNAFLHKHTHECGDNWDLAVRLDGESDDQLDLGKT
jgi:hypothetical protein